MLTRPEQTAQRAESEPSTSTPDIDATAHEDEHDMRLGLQAARLALQVSAMGLKGMSDQQIDDSRATKTWSECIAININTIRKIRGLDEPKSDASNEHATLAASVRGQLGI